MGLPDIDPRQPNLYSRILETAAEERGRRMIEGAAKRSADLDKYVRWKISVQYNDDKRFGPEDQVRVSDSDRPAIRDASAIAPSSDEADVTM